MSELIFILYKTSLEGREGYVLVVMQSVFETLSKVLESF